MEVTATLAIHGVLTVCVSLPEMYISPNPPKTLGGSYYGYQTHSTDDGHNDMYPKSHWIQNELASNMINLLLQGLSDSFCKGPDSKYFTLWGPVVSLATTQFCPCMGEAAIDNA